MNFFKKLLNKMNNQNKQESKQDKLVTKESDNNNAIKEINNKNPTTLVENNKKRIKLAKKICLGLGFGFVVLWILLVSAVKKFVSANGVIDVLANFSMFIAFGLFIAYFVLKRRKKKENND